MKQVLNQKSSIYYVDSSDMIKFIRENSKMKHNDICDFVREKNICNGEYGPSYWERDDLNPDDYNEEQIYWIKNFFDSHPWIDRMMICFND